MSERNGRSGFSLLEMAVALIIIGLISAMGAGMLRSTFESVHSGTTERELNAIETALMAYRTSYNRLPCPADPRLLPTDANYGIEAANEGSCTGGTPVVPFVDSTHQVVEGAVPFRTLGIPESFMYDGWDRKFAFAVNQNVTAANAMQSEALSDQCGIHVTDAGGVDGNRTKGAIYALVSFGPDGHGGYLRNGTRMNASVTNADEETNCHCDANGNGTAYAARYVEKDISLDASDPNHPFQDFVRFKERWQMMTTDDTYMVSSEPVCSHGLRVDGTAVNQQLGQWLGTVDLNGDGIPDLIIADGNGDLFVVFGQGGGGFSSPLKVSDLNGTNGFKITGKAFFSKYESRLAAGDFNGDGIQDIAFAAGNYCGTLNIYIIYGQESGWPASVNLTTLTNVSSPKGTTITNFPGCDYLAFVAGDFNGDTNNGHSIDDIAIGDAYASSQTGDVKIVWGSASPPSSISFTALGANGVNLPGGRAGSYTGRFLATGDFDHDGVADLAIGGQGSDSSTGYGYIVWGHPGAWTGFTLNGGMIAGQGVEINNGGSGASGPYARMLMAAGDLNGDGRDDLALGSNVLCSDTTGCGRIYVFFNGTGLKSVANFDASTLNGTNGTILEGRWALTDIGVGVWGLSDLSGDGKKELLATSSDSGSVYHAYLFNHASPWSNPLSTASLDGSNGFRFTGFTGPITLAVGDINGDGKNDYLIGDSGASPGGAAGAGAAYALKGRSSGWAASYNALALSNDGFEFAGSAAGDKAGTAIISGDLNHDGTTDLVIAAPGHAGGGVSGSGSVYVIWGTTQGWTSGANLGTLLP